MILQGKDHQNLNSQIIGRTFNESIKLDYQQEYNNRLSGNKWNLLGFFFFKLQSN